MAELLMSYCYTYGVRGGGEAGVRMGRGKSTGGGGGV